MLPFAIPGSIYELLCGNLYYLCSHRDRYLGCESTLSGQEFTDAEKDRMVRKRHDHRVVSSFLIQPCFRCHEGLGIRAISHEKFRVSTTDSNRDFPVAPNVVDRDFTALKSNEVWLSDMIFPMESGQDFSEYRGDASVRTRRG